VIVPSHKVPNVNVKSTRLDTTPEAERSSGKVGAGDDGFRTDSQISGGRGIDRGLVKAGPTWTSAGDGGGGLGGDAPVTTMTSAEAGRKGADALNWRAAAARGGRSQAVYRRRWRGGGWPQGRGGGLDGSIGDWDQFSANEKKFNVKASFDENLYTTKLDLSSIDASQRAVAERIANEIESTSSTNMHVAEERNQAIATDYDEEDRYSGVLTNELKARAIVSSPAAAAPAIVKNEKAAAAAVVGKVMNYALAAQAAAKKGMAGMTYEPAAADAATPVLGSIPKVSEAVEKALAAAIKASSTQPVMSQPTKVSSEEEKSMPQGNHEKDAPIDEGDAKKDRSEKDEKKATPSSKLKLNPLKVDGGKVGLIVECASHSTLVSGLVEAVQRRSPRTLACC